MLEALFRPRSVAVVGASQDRTKIGNIIVRNILASGYRGKIYPINPRAEEVEGLRCFPSVTAVGAGAVDLAVIAVPATAVLEVARDCGKAGVKVLVVISAGFRETGKEGLAKEQELVSICREHGMRLLGPNCVGVTDTHAPLNASFAAGFPHQGEIAFISQSGAMLVAILDWSLKENIGFSQFVSMGNKADLNETDLIEAAANDPNTKVILCYLEDIKEGQRFLEVAEQVTLEKPVVVLKSGVSEAGAKAASSHTGALAGSNVAYDTAFRQVGVIRVDTMRELFDLAVVFARQPVPRGKKVAIVTNAGGAGIVAADSVERQGLEMARFDRETLEELRNQLPPASNIFNPVDVLGDARRDRYEAALNQVLGDDNTDGVIVITCPTAVSDPEGVAQTMIELHARFPHKPMLAVLMGGESMAGGLKLLTQAGIPCFTFPELAVGALAGLVRYGSIKTRPPREETPVYPDVRPEEVKRILERVRQERRRSLLSSEGAAVAAAYGIKVAPIQLAQRAAEAVAIAAELGYPVVLKVASPDILHKTDIGGVRVGLKTPDEIRQAFWEIMESAARHFPQANLFGVEVQKMCPRGVELIVGMTRDLQFGPLIAFGLGGVYVNLLKDAAFRLAWGLGSREAESMIRETKAYDLLRGFRGEKPADLKAVVEVVGRVAQLVSDFPDLVEMDINPVFAYPQGAVAVDVKMTIR
ncbi:acetate--CoA ligase alpha subunit [Desulfothermobacter acidiphilus]|uniref:acetate--CoA ligase alpha subunit n=1 Tax=Desulfothermobacter acidiphilus TaxID=1938353 RepID=UPI003F8CA951